MSSDEPLRSTPVDGYRVVEQPPGCFKVLSDEGQVGETFATFSAAYKFIQAMAISRPR